MKFECKHCGRKFRTPEKRTKHENDCTTKQTSITDIQ